MKCNIKTFLKTKKIKIYNHINGAKQVFTPIQNNNIGMYVCGPTVYNEVHLGNCRTFIFFDFILRYFKHLGYKVRYVRNITDIGHLESNNVKDKIIEQSIIEKLEPMEISQKYTLYFHDILKYLNAITPNIEPLASGHITDQIDFIKNIISKGFAYEINGSVYFDIKKYNTQFHYGLLSRLTNTNQIIDYKIRQSFNNDKIFIRDFALWKKSNNYHIMKWHSPWGYGFPGWHIECSVMSTKYLGNNFDIHGGGIDLKFPHHECELAQCTSVYNKPFVNHWIYTNILTFNGFKMSKSKNNFISINNIFNGTTKIFSKPFHPFVLRFFLLQSHYRSVIELSNSSLLKAEKNYNKIIKALHIMDKINNEASKKTSDINVYTWVKTCYMAIDDDFNTPLLISCIMKGVKYINLINNGHLHIIKTDMDIFKYNIKCFVFDVLGLGVISNKNYYNNFLKSINLLIEIRDQLRSKKHWKLSDLIRKRLLFMGVKINDNIHKTTFDLD